MKRKKSKSKNKKNILARDKNILAAFRREIDLREKRIPEKKIYSRKNKHKSKEDQ